MKAFEYAAPRSEAEALELLYAAPGRSEILAGGTDLVALMKSMVLRPERVVNIMEIPSLKGIEQRADGSVVIGASETLDEVLASHYLTDYRAVTDAILGINSMQLQCQGTIGGEICQRARCWFFRNGHGLLAGSELAESGDNRDHAILGNLGTAKFVCGSRIAPALIALGATLRIVGPREQDEQLLAAEEFFQVPQNDKDRETILQPKQLLTHIILPPATATSATYEVRPSVGPDYPLAAAAAALTVRKGVVVAARVVLGQVAPIPWLSREAEGVLLGAAVEETRAAAAGAAAVSGAMPMSGNAHKIQLTQVAVKRAVMLAAGLNPGGL
jgi:xanthine dehydrogenase YagS FAD-binding subunit